MPRNLNQKITKENKINAGNIRTSPNPLPHCAIKKKVEVINIKLCLKDLIMKKQNAIRIRMFTNESIFIFLIFE